MKSNIIHKVVLPVAGMGTRLLPATKAQPKEMLPVGYKPVIQYVVEEMMDQGLDQFLFVTGRKKRAIEDHFDEDPDLAAHMSGKDQGFDNAGARFYYTRQARPKGNADAVRLARDFVGDESFVVGFGDAIIYSKSPPGIVQRLIDAHTEHDAAVTIGVWEVPRAETFKYGIVKPAGEVGNDFSVADIVEKPAVDQAPSCLASAARFVFAPAIFDAIDSIEPGLGGELWLTDAIRWLLARGEKVHGVRLRDDERRYDIGTPLTYYRAFADFALRDPEHGEHFAQYLKEKLAEQQ